MSSTLNLRRGNVKMHVTVVLKLEKKKKHQSTKIKFHQLINTCLTIYCVTIF